MAVMQFLNYNYINTTTLFVVDSGTASVSYLIDRNKKLTYSTSGYTSDTSSIISVEFSSSTIISHILIQNHNLKDFRLFYDSVTANSIQAFSSNSQKRIQFFPHTLHLVHMLFSQ